MTDQPRDDDAPNEILAAVKDAKAHAKAAAENVADRAKNWPVATFGIGFGVGVGSAALAASLLFATRSKKK